MSNNSRANGKGKTSSAATEQMGVEYAARNKKGGEPKGPGAKGGGIPPQQQQQQQQAAAGGGGKPGGGGPKPAQVAAMSAKMTNEILSKYPRLYLDKENKQLTSLTALIDAAYVELVRAFALFTCLPSSHSNDGMRHFFHGSNDGATKRSDAVPCSGSAQTCLDARVPS